MDTTSNIPQSGFFDPDDVRLSTDFLHRGYAIRPAESTVDLDRIRELVAAAAADYLRIELPSDLGCFLNHMHDHVQTHDLNNLRLHVIHQLNQADWLRPAYFRLARRFLEIIVGNELAMQLRLNLSIQLPNDAGSLLPIHADVWSGDSPFEVVLWVPLVDCYNTKAMFLLPPEPAQRLHADFAQTAGNNSEQLFQSIASEISWININYGDVLLFNQNLPHGNRLNVESETRWSMNCRFKGIFTPYADKRLGEFFEPITLRPASRIGLDYKLPSVHKRAVNPQD